MGTSLHAQTYSWDVPAFCSGGLDFMLWGGLCPQQRANVAGIVSCLGMAGLNVQPPGSVKAAPSPLPTPLVPPCCLHVQEHVGPYPAWLGHKTCLRLNGAAFPFWFNIISNLGSDLNGSIAHMGWLQLPSCCPKLKQDPV